MANIVTGVLVDPATGKQIPLQFIEISAGVYALHVSNGGTGSGAGADQVQGNVAHDGVDAGSPLKIGGKAFTLASTPAAVASLDRVDAAFSLKGAQYVIPTDDAGDIIANALGLFSQGPTAAAAAVSGNPVQVAGSDGTNVRRLLTDTGGRLFVDGAYSNGGGLVSSGIGVVVRDVDGSVSRNLVGNATGLIVIPPRGWSYAAAASGIVNSTTAVTVKAAAAAGIRNYVSSIQLSWDALGAATEFAIRDGAAGTVLWRHKIQTATGQIPVVFNNPLFGTAATLLEIVTLTASVTGGVFANLQGYTAP